MPRWQDESVLVEDAPANQVTPRWMAESDPVVSPAAVAPPTVSQAPARTSGATTVAPAPAAAQPTPAAPVGPPASLAPPPFNLGPPGGLTAQQVADQQLRPNSAVNAPWPQMPVAPVAPPPAPAPSQTLASVGRKFVGGVTRGFVETMGAGIGGMARYSPDMQGPAWTEDDALRAGMMATGGRGMPRSATEAAGRETAYSVAKGYNPKQQAKRNYFDNEIAAATRAGTVKFEGEKAVEMLPAENPVVAIGNALGRAAARIAKGPQPPSKDMVAAAKSRLKTDTDWLVRWNAAGRPPMDEWLKTPEVQALITGDTTPAFGREHTSFDDWLADGAPDDVAKWYNSPKAKAARKSRQAPEDYKPTYRMRTRGQAVADEINKGIQRLTAEHPDWQTPQVNTAKELMSNPEALAGNMGATLPYMGGTLIAMLSGNPAAAFLIGVAVEGDQAYQQAKTDMQAQIEQLQATGNMQEAAELQRNMEGNAAATAAVVGTANAIVEQAQISGMIKVGNPAAKAMLARNLSRLAKAKIAGGMIAKQAFEEGFEETIQGATQDLTAGVVYQKKIDPEQFWNQRKIEGLMGALAYGPGGITSTGFHYLTQSKANAEAQREISRIQSAEKQAWDLVRKNQTLNQAEAQAAPIAENMQAGGLPSRENAAALGRDARIDPEAPAGVPAPEPPAPADSLQRAIQDIQAPPVQQVAGVAPGQVSSQPPAPPATVKVSLSVAPPAQEPAPPAPKPAAQQGEAKRPWEMTKAEYVASVQHGPEVREDYAEAWVPVKLPYGTPESIDFEVYWLQGGRSLSVE